MKLRLGIGHSVSKVKVIIITIGLAIVEIAGPLAFKFMHAEFLFQEGLKAYHRQDFVKAEDFWSRSLAEQKQDPSLSFQYSESATNLGYIVSLSGRNEEAKGLLKEAISIRSKLGKDWHKAISMHHLGRVYMREGHLAEAESLLKSAHATFERLCGENNIDTVDSVRSLQELARL